jgi:transposase-like protein
MKQTPHQIKEQAAVLVAEARYEYGEIAEKVGVSVRTLNHWRKDPKFAARVDELSREFAAAALKRGIARKEYRVNTLANIHSKLLSVIEDRATDPDLAGIPGGDTGLIVRKAVVSAGALVGYEFEVDTGTLRELRGIQEQVAKELGQLVEKKEMKIRSLKDLTDEELDAIINDTEESGASSDGAEGEGEAEQA